MFRFLNYSTQSRIHSSDANILIQFPFKKQNKKQHRHVDRADPGLRAAQWGRPLTAACGCVRQGESDCDCDDKAAAFSAKLPRLLAAFRERLGVPELPIVQVRPSAAEPPLCRHAGLHALAYTSAV